MDELLKCSRCNMLINGEDAKLLVINLMGKPIVLCPNCFEEFQEFLSNPKYRWYYSEG